MILYLHPQTRNIFLVTEKFLTNDLVAQLVEHLPFKEVVLGSSPSQVTQSRQAQRFDDFFVSQTYMLRKI